MCASKTSTTLCSAALICSTTCSSCARPVCISRSAAVRASNTSSCDEKRLPRGDSNGCSRPPAESAGLGPDGPGCSTTGTSAPGTCASWMDTCSNKELTLLSKASSSPSTRISSACDRSSSAATASSTRPSSLFNRPEPPSSLAAISTTLASRPSTFSLIAKVFSSPWDVASSRTPAPPRGVKERLFAKRRSSRPSKARKRLSSSSIVFANMPRCSRTSSSRWASCRKAFSRDSAPVSVGCNQLHTSSAPATLLLP